MFRGRNGPGYVKDKWHNVAHMSNLSIKLEQKRNWERWSQFVGQYVRERKRGEKESSQDFSFRSTEFCRSEFVWPRTKVYLLDEGYTWVPKRRDLIEDPKEEVLGNRIFRNSEVFSRPSSILLHSKR